MPAKDHQVPSRAIQLDYGLQAPGYPESLGGIKRQGSFLNICTFLSKHHAKQTKIQPQLNRFGLLIHVPS